MITAKELMKLLGARGTVNVACAGLKLTGRIEDVKQAYGNIRYVIAIDGQDARISVNAESFTIATKEKN